MRVATFNISEVNHEVVLQRLDGWAAGLSASLGALEGNNVIVSKTCRDVVEPS